LDLPDFINDFLLTFRLHMVDAVVCFEMLSSWESGVSSSI